MALIETLTPEQEALLAQRHQQRLLLARSTAALNRAAAHDAVCAIYQAVGAPAPQVLFFPSPRSCIEHYLQLPLLRSDHDSVASRIEQWRFTADARLQYQKTLGRGNILAYPHPWERVHGLLWDAFLPWDEIFIEVTRALDRQLLPKDEPAPPWWFSGGWVGRSHHDEINEYCCTAFGGEEDEDSQPWPLWKEEADQCHLWLACEAAALLVERPQRLMLDATERLHSESGPALEYADGFALYAWHGTVVEERIITDPQSITLQQIQHGWDRPAQRRVMIERFGIERYIASSSAAQVIDTVSEEHPLVGLRGARLLRCDLTGEPEPLVFLEMLNSTPEPDGTHRRYLERIDPKAYNGDAARCCHAAMASLWWHRNPHGELVRSFERWQDYSPDSES